MEGGKREGRSHDAAEEGGMNWGAMGLMALILLAACLFAEIATWATNRGVPVWVPIAVLFAAAIIAVGVLA